ncbi:S9 family peptidase [Parvularcula lutaonensis]|uniref:Acyl-peptide hydrolase n=1 Tax=Parvularcula lutaonensis TaxID=491923 RepID=A0ABV7MFT1_9PROT|nr:S9 family peptidase [Parvularcula lutaonensis]GGY55291.1 peptidase S9 [Parvularcula lutaonensis]
MLSGIAAAVLSLSAIAEAQEVPIYPAEAFFETARYRLAGPGGAWTTDGRYLLMSSDETGIFNAYRFDTETGEKQPLTRSRDRSIFVVSWMPDDQSFIYSADNGGDELNHLYLQRPDGLVIDLTPGKDVKADFLGWERGKRGFFVSTNRRDSSAFDIYRYDAFSLDSERLFENDMKLGQLTVSPDGTMAAGVLEKGAADNDVYLIDLDGNDAPRLLTEHEGDISHSINAFDPRSERLIIGTNAGSEFEQAVAIDLRRGASSTLIAEPWDVSYVSYSPSGRYRVSAINEDGTTKATIFDRMRNREVRIPGNIRRSNLSQVRFTPNERKVALLSSTSATPANIMTMDMGAGGRAEQLTDALRDRIDPDHLVEAEVIRYPSYDGLEIPAIQYKPHAASAKNKVPAIVLVHGGPGGQSRASYNPMVQHLVNNGYGVLAANNRGSSGYGKTFYHLDDRRHGDVDLKDIVAARGYLEDLDWVDPDKIVVMGGSYGGYMTMAALAFHPEVFDAGINIFGVTNWERTLSSIPPWWGSFRTRLYDEMGDPATDRERHRRISPLFFADQVTKPVLIVQGANDPRVLQVESDEMVEELRKNGVPVEYVLFPDEGHGFQKRDNRITASKAYVRFLDRHLYGDE